MMGHHMNAFDEEVDRLYQDHSPKSPSFAKRFLAGMLTLLLPSNHSAWHLIDVKDAQKPTCKGKEHETR